VTNPGSRREPGWPGRRRPLTATFCLLACLCVLPAWSDAEAPAPAVKRLDVRVTAYSGGSIYLDRGRDHGIAAGDIVVIYPSGGAAFEAIIRGVSKSNARVELPPGTQGINIQDRGEVLLPVVRLEEEEEAETIATAEAEAKKRAIEVPDHPEWSAPPEEWDDDAPLLSPAFSRTNEEKPTLMRGRVFFMGQNNWDDENDNEFSSARLGTELYIENPWERGGEIHFDGEMQLRAADIDGGDDSSSTRGRVDRLSYSFGGTRDDPDFMEAGRFLQNEFPEFGVLDGIEYSSRLESGGRLGASFGYMPELNSPYETGQDMQLAVFYRTDTGDPRDMILGVAYQNTWHKGSNDRNLMVGTLDWNPNDQLSVYGSAWVDYYNGSDEEKGDGFELTEFRLNSVYRITDATGVGANVSHSRWPELMRNEFSSSTAADVLDNRTTRTGINAWHKIDNNLRVDGRVDYWKDEDDSGNSGDIRVALRDVLYEQGEVAVALFTTKGSFTDGKGVRVTANKSLADGTFALLSWEGAKYQQNTSNGTDTDLDQQTLRASIDMLLGATRNISVYAEKRSGDEVDSKSLGVFFQQRF